MMISPAMCKALTKRFQAKWAPVRVKKTRQQLKIGALALISIRARALIEVELIQLPVLGLDVTDSASDGTHHDGFGFDHILAELDAGQQGTRGDAGRREQAVAPRHVLDAVDHLGIGDAHLVRALAPFL